MPRAKRVTEETTEEARPKIEGLTEGRIVHYVMAAGDHRPAIITEVVGRDDGMCNLTVFLDGTNDGFSSDSPILWMSGIPYDPERGLTTWHFIEYVA